ncbi:MAG: hypothetical protein J6Y16_02280 [Treponema sp.]|nr:hypothetical protein [Treponema sp.]
METDITTVQNEEAVKTQRINCFRKVASNLKILYKLRLAEWILVGILFITIITTTILTMNKNEASVVFWSVLVKVLAPIPTLVSLASIVILFMLGKYYNDYKLAGIFYLISVLITLTARLTDIQLLSIIGGVFSILYILKFTEAMTDPLSYADLNLASDWESLRGLYITTYVGIGASALLGVIPIINILALLAMLGFVVLSIVVGIKEIILIHHSAKALILYINTNEQGRSQAGTC